MLPFSLFALFPCTGTVLIPGTSQLTARDICHRLQTSGAKCVITDESLAPLLDTVASDCPSISTKLLLSHRAMHGWGNLTELMGWVESRRCVCTGSTVVYWRNDCVHSLKVYKKLQIGDLFNIRCCICAVEKCQMIMFAWTPGVRRPWLSSLPVVQPVLQKWPNTATVVTVWGSQWTAGL